MPSSCFEDQTEYIAARARFDRHHCGMKKFVPYNKIVKVDCQF